MPATNYPPGMMEAAAKILESAPAKSAAPDTLPRIGNLSFAYMHVGAPERVLEFYEDEVSAGYFQPISATWFWHPTYAAGAQDRAVQTGDTRPGPGRILGRARLAAAVPSGGDGQLLVRMRAVTAVAGWAKAPAAAGGNCSVASRDFAHAVSGRTGTAWAKAHERLPELPTQ
jgi:hypothetical protein